MKRGGRLVISLGLGLLGALVVVWARIQTLRLTEGEALVALWPAWLLAAALLLAAAWLLNGVRS